MPGHAGRERPGPSVQGHGAARPGRAEEGDVEGVEARGGEDELGGPEGGRGRRGLEPLVKEKGVRG